MRWVGVSVKVGGRVLHGGEFGKMRFRLWEALIRVGGQGVGDRSVYILNLAGVGACRR